MMSYSVAMLTSSAHMFKFLKSPYSVFTFALKESSIGVNGPLGLHPWQSLWLWPDSYFHGTLVLLGFMKSSKPTLAQIVPACFLLGTAQA